MHSPTTNLNQSHVPYRLDKHRLTVIGFSSICWFAFYMLCGWLLMNVIPDFLKAKNIPLGWMLKWEIWAILSVVAALVLTLRREIHYAYKGLREAPKLLVLFLGFASLLVIMFYGGVFITDINRLFEALTLSAYQADWMGYGLLFASFLSVPPSMLLFFIASESSKILWGE